MSLTMHNVVIGVELIKRPYSIRAQNLKKSEQYRHSLGCAGLGSTQRMSTVTITNLRFVFGNRVCVYW